MIRVFIFWSSAIISVQIKFFASYTHDFMHACCMQLVILFIDLLIIIIIIPFII